MVSTFQTNCRIMGVINVTPDSFSDGGAYFTTKACLKRIEDMIVEGVDIIELGAESTRPGSSYVTESEEIQRLAPILEHLDQYLSATAFAIDTRKPRVMRQAIEHGVTYVNNVEGLCDDSTLRFVAQSNVNYIAMHIHRTPIDMQKHPLDRDEAISSFREFVETAQQKLLASGLSPKQIYLDPGIGFGKTDSANLALLGETPRFSSKVQLAIGISRKGFITRLFGAKSLEERDMCSKIWETSLIQSGAAIIRTHAVKQLIELRNLVS